MTEKLPVPRRVVPPSRPLDMGMIDGSQCPYTGDVYRVRDGRIVVEQAVPTPPKTRGASK